MTPLTTDYGLEGRGKGESTQLNYIHKYSRTYIKYVRISTSTVPTVHCTSIVLNIIHYILHSCTLYSEQ